ncbi:ABC transporter permease [Streptomyces zagrosensis]|uniref:Transport permease protein n=1 Tax=Streptomyces zagrosensis TaxID=1042984 RepID=A0A7W9UWE4_9ACTN|nr:ABC transporter permease [Streptomyces zagrosensis]MBB5933810.1 ABC-2 type transport system permease protein [Streptomyces zagrosensis]
MSVKARHEVAHVAKDEVAGLGFGGLGSGGLGSGGPGGRRRLRALTRAELTLLGRSKAALLTALGVPIALTCAVKSTVDGLDLDGTGLDTGTVLLPGAIGFVLLFAVYSNLVLAYVVRREELVLKRLRCGELSDTEILIGTALPSVVVALVQCLVLGVGSAWLLGVAIPEAPPLVLIGLLIGVLMLTALAAVTAAVTNSAEAAQVSVMPLLMVSLMGSGLFVPLEVMPDRVTAVCELLPLTAVIELLRGGWTGALDSGEVTKLLITAVAWAVLSVFAVRRWFRWEPRR